MTPYQFLTTDEQILSSNFYKGDLSSINTLNSSTGITITQADADYISSIGWSERYAGGVDLASSSEPTFTEVWKKMVDQWEPCIDSKDNIKYVELTAVRAKRNHKKIKIK